MNDLNVGLRVLRKSPGPSLFAVLALTLGIGLSVMMFSIIYGALHRGLPFEKPEQLVHLERARPSRGIESMEVTIHDFTDWRAQQRQSFVDLGAWYSGTVNVADGGVPERYDGAFITPSTFPLLGVRPLHGRLFREEETSRAEPMVVLIGYRMWQDRYEGDPGIVGRVIRVNGEPATIIGVMPEDFLFPFNHQIWVPLRLDPLTLKRGEGITLEVLGRLRDGVTIDRAMIEMTGITQRLAAEYPETNEGISPVIKPFTEEYIGEEPTRMLYTMLGAVFFVLLIACANVANLLMSRAAMRTKEVGIRTALGASKTRIITQFMTEALLLAIAGALLGLLVSWAGVRIFNAAIADTNPPYWIDIRIDGVAILFALGVTGIAALISGAIPAYHAARANVNEILKDESRGSSSFRLGRFSKAIVVFEIALSCGLLIGAGLMIKSVTQLKTIDFNFPTEIFTARIGLMEAAYPDSIARYNMQRELLQRLQQMPELESATLLTGLPGLGTGGAEVRIEGVEYDLRRELPIVLINTIAPNYFETFQVPLLEGRAFGEQDRMDAPRVAIVNQSFVARFFNGASPIGRRIRFGRQADAPWVTIVGVAPDMFEGGLDSDRREALYTPIAQSPPQFFSIAARTRGEPLAVTQRVRAEVNAIDADLPIYFVRTLQDAIDQSYWFYSVFGVLFMVFGGAALFLAGVGLYGVMATSVAQRTREVGVRMALGAQARDVLTMVLRQGMSQIAIGIALGLGIAAALGNLLSLVLYQVNPRDPVVFASIITFLVMAALLACFVPARRATRVDPNIALRAD